MRKFHTRNIYLEASNWLQGKKRGINHFLCYILAIKLHFSSQQAAQRPQPFPPSVLHDFPLQYNYLLEISTSTLVRTKQDRSVQVQLVLPTLRISTMQSLFKFHSFSFIIELAPKFPCQAALTHSTLKKKEWHFIVPPAYGPFMDVWARRGENLWATEINQLLFLKLFINI